MKKLKNEQKRWFLAKFENLTDHVLSEMAYLHEIEEISLPLRPSLPPILPSGALLPRPPPHQWRRRYIALWATSVSHPEMLSFIDETITLAHKAFRDKYHCYWRHCLHVFFYKTCSPRTEWKQHQIHMIMTLLIGHAIVQCCCILADLMATKVCLFQIFTRFWMRNALCCHTIEKVSLLQRIKISELIKMFFIYYFKSSPKTTL